MSGILDLLKSGIGKDLINGVSQQMGLNKASVASVLGSAIPLILGGMQNNASSANGASGLLGALGDSKHNGSILDNLSSILGGTNIDSDILSDGKNILGHIFGGHETHAAHAIGKSNGIDLKSAMNIMKMAAPFVMGYLGKQVRSKGVSDQHGLSGLLGELLGGSNDSQREMASKLQSFDANDLSVDDIAGMVSKADKQSGGIADILTGLFN